MGSPIYSYQQVASTTSKLEQIVMLYDGAIKFLLQMANDIRQKDMLAKTEHVDRALAIIDYLRAILDMSQGGEVAQNLDRTYNILTSQIILANATLDADMVDSVVALLREIRSAWQQIAAGSSNVVPVAAPETKTGLFQTELRSVRITG
ncbi:MAG TPA: flagellar export chaperone FliS [Blastocatellia bacterium]|nr:flagellar export chaperone FliS [Blastocatellia bacterium]